MLAKHETVVSHVDDERLFVDAHLFQLLHNGSDAVINAAQSFAVSLVEPFDALTSVQGKVHAVPTVALV